MSNMLEVLEELQKGLTTKPYLYATSGAAAISKKTTVNDDFSGKWWKPKSLRVTFSTAPTTSQNFTVTVNPSGGWGDRPSTVIFSQDPSTTSATSILQIWEDDSPKLAPGDEVTLAYTNTDTRTIKAELEVEVL